MIDRQASRLLVSFIRLFIDLQEKQLEGIHKTMRETVDGVMRDINLLSQRTQKKKDEANAVLEKTYTEPDSEVQAAIDDAQSEVDRVFNNSKTNATQQNQDDAPSEEVLRQKLRRSTGVFSKHMESLATLDGEVQEILFSMMGQLSRDDVISQRIEHTMMSLQAMQTNLTYLLHDFEIRCNQAEVQKFAEDLRSFSLRIYTMQEERKVHYAFFPEDAPVKKAAI